ncbi:MAG: glycerol-3-phosphate responsive antiterminator [Oscillospiraceae bacterium]|jgi:glycerol uptake operon antiterminator|nr:glycerol-3-phosphate responsive antiterminator [Oscillospiraceae bacterium]
MEVGSFYGALKANPIIAAVKSAEGLSGCLKSDCGIVFVLFGDILSIADHVRRIKDAQKLAVVHIDLIDGLSPKEVSVRFMRDSTAADGIISTRQPLISSAKDLGLLTVHRFFILDSIALSNVEKQMRGGRADVVEILPGCMPKVISRLVKKIDVPLIAGGLISDGEDAAAALAAGASAISTTNPEVWFK